jgi:hypothetical protein
MKRAALIRSRMLWLILGAAIGAAGTAGAATRYSYDVYPGDNISVPGLDLFCSDAAANAYQAERLICARYSVHNGAAAVWIMPRAILVGHNARTGNTFLWADKVLRNP